MKQSASPRRSAWFWVGVTLLTLSTLYWLTVILTIVDQPEADGDMVFTGVIFTAIPIGIGIYGIRRCRKPPAVEVGSEPAYPTQAAAKSAQEMKQSAGRKSSAWFWVGFTLLLLSAFAWLMLILATVSESGDIGEAIVVGVIATAVPIGIGIFCVWHGRKAPPVHGTLRFARNFLIILLATGGIVGVSVMLGIYVNERLGFIVGALSIGSLGLLAQRLRRSGK